MSAEDVQAPGSRMSAGRDLASRSWDVIVVGAGHNGLTAAAYLARTGKRVLVLERRDVVGGGATVEETFPGYRISPCAYLVGLLHPKVIDELQLRRHGYRASVLDPQLVVPFGDGTALVEWNDDERTAAGIAAWASAREAEGYRRYTEFWARIRAALRPPTDDDIWLAQPASREEVGARLGHDPEAAEALFHRSQVDHLRRFFADSRLIDALAGQGVIGTFASPYEEGTASIAFHHSSGRVEGQEGSWGFVEGGMGRVSLALADAAREAGAAIATGVPVARILPGKGVALESGVVVRAPVVVSNADPKRTVALLGESAPAAYRDRVEATRTESPVVKVTYALSGLPSYTGVEGSPGSVNATRGADALHASCLAARRGEVTDELWAELYLAPPTDPPIAPDGYHVLSAFCQYVPYRLAAGTWDERREEIGDRVDASIERFAPGFRALVVARDVKGPPDVEAKIGLTGGHIFQGELLPDAMWDRRLGYRTPVEGVYLCGAGTYPGGSVMAVNGRNAAVAVATDQGWATP